MTVTANIAPYEIQRFFDAAGVPLAGGKLFTYAAGTTTKQTTYTDSTGGTPNTNPIILDSAGYCNLWLDATLTYKFTLSPATDTDPPTNPIWTVDQLNNLSSAILSFLLSATGAVTRTVNAKLSDFIATKDTGAIGDGGTDDQTAVGNAIMEAAATGGTVVIPSTSLLDFGRKLYPGTMEVNHHDYGIIGTDNKISNPTFATLASGWTLANFTASGTPDKITHAAGTVGTASIPGMLLEPYCLYAVQLTVVTTTSGVINMTLNGQDLIVGVYTDAANTPINGYWFDSAAVPTTGTGADGTSNGWPATSGTVWTFLYLNSNANASTGNFVLTTDTRWAGNIQVANVIKLQQEPQFAGSSLSQAEGAAGTYRTPVGWKNYNNESGCMVFGDRMTGALIPITPLTPPYSGAFNTIVGFKAATSQMNGVENTFIGAYSGQSVDGSANTAVGYSAMKYATKSMECTAVGYKCMPVNVLGLANTALGFQAMFESRTGNYNTALGWGAMRLAVGASNCTAVGFAAGISNSGGADCTFVGYRAGPWTADIGTAITGYTQQTAIGSSVLLFGNSNTGVGYGCNCGTSPGATVTNSVAVGYGAAVTDSSAVAVGETAAVSAVNGVAVGSASSVGGVGGVAIGRAASAPGANTVAAGLSSIATGQETVAIGFGSGINVSGIRNTSVGSGSGATGGAQTYTNCTSLGYASVPSADNQVTLGNAAVATLRCQQTSITALSDQRDKTDVKPLSLGLDFINTIELVEFTWKVRGGSERDGKKEAGVIAQQLGEAQAKAGADWMELILNADPERLEATPGKLLFPLIKAVQELSAEVARFRAELAAVKTS